MTEFRYDDRGRVLVPLNRDQLRHLLATTPYAVIPTEGVRANMQRTAELRSLWLDAYDATSAAERSAAIRDAVRAEPQTFTTTTTMPTNVVITYGEKEQEAARKFTEQLDALEKKVAAGDPDPGGVVPGSARAVEPKAFPTKEAEADRDDRAEKAVTDAIGKAKVSKKRPRDRVTTAEIRAWAIEQDYAVSSMGRLPEWVLTSYDLAHG